MPAMVLPYLTVTKRNQGTTYMKRLFTTGFLFLVVSLAGCATNTGIVNLGPDTYTLYKTDHAGVFGSVDLLRLDVIGQANTFAEAQGKIAYPISAKTHPIDWPKFASFEYQFRLVDKNDRTARKTYLVPGSDVVTDEAGKVTGNAVTNTQPEKTSDRYAELVKLDDLRKKGIISEAEFEAEKKKLLGGN